MKFVLESRKREEKKSLLTSFFFRRLELLEHTATIFKVNIFLSSLTQYVVCIHIITNFISLSFIFDQFLYLFLYSTYWLSRHIHFLAFLRKVSSQLDKAHRYHNILAFLLLYMNIKRLWNFARREKPVDIKSL